ncbi:ABC transporter ATP-binding protein [Pseudomonas sp. RIT-PI-AD]|uniref:ABC transporter ATP-binding protein n=1 Tax=Pseudomonas sp. RIT-PI-AD TaxID=3035294 RepID=UPI0021D82B48|nr:ABC transporter ATP-binding protein [Pseudomonas sp. RIT-PI-AD]
MLKVEGLRAGYNGSDAIRGVSLEIPTGQVVAVLGPNGAGKSTLVNAISGLTRIHQGEILFEGRAITRLSPPEIVELGIIQVPEGRQLFGPLTVAENLSLGFQRLRGRKGASALFRQRLEYVYELFPRLHERAGQRTVTLSGGEQSMVAMGRALMADPRLLLLDEPSIGLAPLVVELLFEVLKKLRESGLTMLVVEQHAEESLRLADYGYVMATGAITAQGTGEALSQSDALQHSYLGEVQAPRARVPA